MNILVRALRFNLKRKSRADCQQNIDQSDEHYDPPIKLKSRGDHVKKTSC